MHVFDYVHYSVCMYVYVHIYTRVCLCARVCVLLAHTLTHIYSLPGVQVQEQIPRLVGGFSERPDGFIDLAGDPAGPGFAATASGTPVSVDS